MFHPSHPFSATDSMQCLQGIAEFEDLALSKPHHELYDILANRLLLHGADKPFSDETNAFIWLLREYGERYQIRELYRAILYVIFHFSFVASLMIHSLVTSNCHVILSIRLSMQFVACTFPSISVVSSFGVENL